MSVTEPSTYVRTLSNEAYEGFLSPRRVALIGASEDPDKSAGRPLRYLQRYGFGGQVIPVNPSRSRVLGVPAVPSIDAIEGGIDLAVILTSAERSVAAVESCVARDVPSAIVIAAGFAELDSRGAEIQADVERALTGGRTRLLGPNTVGVVSARSNLVAAIATGMDQDRFELSDGGIALVTQSGAVGAFIVNSAQSRGVGVGTMISTGNEMDIGFSEIVASLLEDSEINAVIGYIEGIRDPQAFVEVLARAAELGKPLAFLKSGKSNLGRAAAASHTGALAGECGVYSGIFAQFGVTEADSIEGLLDWASMVSVAKRLGSSRVSVVTSSGGAGILSADYADQEQLALAEWSDQWKDRLADLLPAFLAPKNPIDMGANAGNAAELGPVMSLMGEHEETDVVLVVIGNLEQDEEALVEAIATAAAEAEKAVVVSWIAGSGKPLADLNRRGVPTYTDPQRAIRVMGQFALSERRQRDRTADATGLPVDGVSTPPGAAGRISAALSGGRSALDELESEELLADYGFTIPRHVLASTADEAVAGADTIGYPIVLKIVSPSIQHKTEHQGVFVGLHDSGEVREKAESVLARRGDSLPADTQLLLQEMVPGGVELLFGMKHDSTFGPVILFGLGGVMTELFNDVKVRLPHCTRTEILTALRELKGAQLLGPFRGQCSIDLDGVADAIQNLARLTRDLGDDISAIDINPLIAHRGNGTLTAVDASVLLGADTRESQA